MTSIYLAARYSRRDELHRYTVELRDLEEVEWYPDWAAFRAAIGPGPVRPRADRPGAIRNPGRPG